MPLYTVESIIATPSSSVSSVSAIVSSGNNCSLYCITPTLRDTLHWLPVRHRITYKIATIAFRCVRGASPACFTDVCIPVETVAGRAKLRSARHGELIVPPTKTETFGSRSFRSAAPIVWNSLLHHIRQSDVSRGQLASRLKTWLFSCAYT